MVSCLTAQLYRAAGGDAKLRDSAAFSAGFPAGPLQAVYSEHAPETKTPARGRGCRSSACGAAQSGRVMPDWKARHASAGTALPATRCHRARSALLKPLYHAMPKSASFGISGRGCGIASPCAGSITRTTLFASWRPLRQARATGSEMFIKLTDGKTIVATRIAFSSALVVCNPFHQGNQ